MRNKGVWSVALQGGHCVSIDADSHIVVTDDGMGARRKRFSLYAAVDAPTRASLRETCIPADDRRLEMGIRRLIAFLAYSHKNTHGEVTTKPVGLEGVLAVIGRHTASGGAGRISL